MNSPRLRKDRFVITGIKPENFTVFRRLDFQPVSGVNVLYGGHGVGKTHLLKLMYAACAVSKKTQENLAGKLVQVFLPTGGVLGRLVSRGDSRASVKVSRNSLELSITFSSRAKRPAAATITGMEDWVSKPLECAYIPARDILANAPGFRSLYYQRDIHFEGVYVDILEKAYLPPLRSLDNDRLIKALRVVHGAIGGYIRIRNEEFFLETPDGDIEFTLLSDGLRRLGLIDVLIRNGSIREGSVLFWDTPDANLTSRLADLIAEILMHIQSAGVQVFVATNNYDLLERLDSYGAAVKLHNLAS